MIDIEALPESFYEYVANHLNDDTQRLLLTSRNGRYDFPIDFAISQIQARQKIKNKLRGFTSSPYFLYSTPLLAEQCTAWPIARFHASLLNCQGPLRIADLTCGLGIDAFAMSQAGAIVTATDIDALAAACATHNAQILGYNNFQCIHADASVWLAEKRRDFDLIFIDPARRKDGNRTYSFHDCSPDITAHLPLLRASTPRMMVKASPMLDITATLNLIPDITHLYIIALRGECKEVLADVEFQSPSHSTAVSAINLNAEGDEISRFSIQDYVGTRSADAPIATSDRLREGAWLSEPDSAVMKTGAWLNISNQYPGMEMLHPHTHLFVSDEMPQNFPGRTWKINQIWHSAKDAMRRVKGEKINVTTRNYPLTPQNLAQKLGVHPCDTNNRFIIGATSRASGKILMEVEKKNHVSENGTGWD